MMRRLGKWLVAALLLATPLHAQDGPAGYTVMGPLNKLPNGGRPQAKVPFPEIKDWQSLKITLERGPCFGSCPDYRLEIGGDGGLRYEGRHFVAIPGVHTGRIDPGKVRALYDQFRQADFFWLLDNYRASITDFPAFTIAISFDGQSKTVTDYAGTAIGMPAQVRALEATVDAAADTARWVNGNENTLAALKAEGWDFKSASAANTALLATAALRNRDFLHALIGEGVPVQSPGGCAALDILTQRHDIDMAKELLADGAPVQAMVDDQTGHYPCSVLQSAAAAGDVALVQLVLDRHPDINGQDRIGRTALFCAVQGAVMTFGPRATAATDFPGVIRLLREKGADVSIAARMGLNPAEYLAKFGHARPPEVTDPLNAALDADLTQPK